MLKGNRWVVRRREFCEFFQNLFTSSSPGQNQIEEALKKLLPQVTPDMNAQLEESFTLEDIENALSQMCQTKALGPDGLPVAFFQNIGFQFEVE